MFALELRDRRQVISFGAEQKSCVSCVHLGATSNAIPLSAEMRFAWLLLLLLFGLFWDRKQRDEFSGELAN